MREIAVQGKVRRVEYREWTSDDGVVHPQGSLVLDTEYDKLEVGLERGADEYVIAQLRGLKRGEDVRVLIGVASGDSFRADPKFFFLDDLTAHPAGSGAKG